MSDFEQKHMEALNALRDETKRLSPEQEAKINSLLDLQEAKNQAKFKEIQEKTNKAEETEARLNSLEADLKRGIGGEEKAAKTQELKAFETYLRKNSGLLGEELKYLRTDIDSQGGYLLPNELDSEIIKKIIEISVIRSVARVRPMSSKSLGMPTRSTIVSTGMVGEGEEDTQSYSTYGLEKLFAKKGQVTIASTIEELEDSSFDIANLIMQDTGEEFARLEGAQFTLGSGAGNNCQGFMANANIAEVNSGSASTLTFDSLITLTGELKTGYNPIFGMNRKTLAIIRKLKDNNGQYLWVAGSLSAGVPNQISGHNYIEIPDMPNIGADLFPVIYGDFRRGYTIGDRKGLTMVRDEVTQKRQGKVEFTFYKRFAGMVTLPEAFVKLKISA